MKKPITKKKLIAVVIFFFIYHFIIAMVNMSEQASQTQLSNEIPRMEQPTLEPPKIKKSVTPTT